MMSTDLGVKILIEKRIIFENTTVIFSAIL